MRKIDALLRELSGISVAITNINRALSAEKRNPKWSAAKIQSLEALLASLKKRKVALNNQTEKANRRKNCPFKRKNRKSNCASLNPKKGAIRKRQMLF
jgi:ribosome-binding ATPase YchF (GTP1/OBG family)